MNKRTEEQAPIYKQGDERVFTKECGCTDLNTCTEPALLKRSGQMVTIIRLLTDAEADLLETGPMYAIRFEDGYEDSAYESELNTR